MLNLQIINKHIVLINSYVYLWKDSHVNNNLFASLFYRNKTFQQNQRCRYEIKMSLLGLWYFCHRLFQHLLMSRWEETRGWRYASSVEILSQNSGEQIVSSTEVDNEHTSGFCVVEQLSSMIGIFLIWNSFFGPTADFLLYHIFPSFPFSQGLTATSFHIRLSLVNSSINCYTAVPSCLPVTILLASLIFPC